MSANISGLLIVLVIFGGLVLLNVFGYLLYICYKKIKNENDIAYEYKQILTQC